MSTENQPPVAVGDAAAATSGDAVEIDVLGNDSDPDPQDLIRFLTLAGAPAAIGAPVALPSGATVTLGADGRVTYDPAGAFDALPPGAEVEDAFDYVIGDGAGGSASAAVTVTVAAPPPPTEFLAVDSGKYRLQIDGSAVHDPENENFISGGASLGFVVFSLEGLEAPVAQAELRFAGDLGRFFHGVATAYDQPLSLRAYQGDLRRLLDGDGAGDGDGAQTWTDLSAGPIAATASIPYTPAPVDRYEEILYHEPVIAPFVARLNAEGIALINDALAAGRDAVAFALDPGPLGPGGQIFSQTSYADGITLSTETTPMPIERLSASSYGVQYVQGPDALDVAGLAAAPHEVLILEPLNLAPGYDAVAGAADVATLQAAGKQVFLYMTVGESADIRRYWDPAWTDPANAKPTGALPSGGGADVDGRTASAPSWLSDWISGASGGAARLVQFWDPAWLAVLEDEIDFLLGDLGADGLFLDNVASYFEWITFDGSDRAGRPDVRPEDDLDQPATFYASAMADLVGAVSAYVQANHPGAKIIANGNPFLPFDTGDRAGKGQLFLDSISAMLQEGVYHSNGERYDNAVTQDALKTIVAAEGIPILALDYVDPADQAKIDAFVQDAANDGFLPYADELDLALDGLQAALNQPTDGDDRLFLPDAGGTVDALGGADEIFGGDGADEATGGPGDDVFFGGGADDTWRVDADRADAFAAASRPDPSGPILLTLNGGLGVDQLKDVEFVAFADQTVAAESLLPAPLDGPNGAPTVVSVEKLDTDDRVLVRWRVDNTGSEALGATNISVQIVDQAGSAPQGRTATSSVQALAPGASDAGSAGFTLPTGYYTARLNYDVGGQVAEADETDNIVVGELFTVGSPSPLPDLIVTDVTLDVTDIGAGETVRVSFTLRNQGDAAVDDPAFSARLALGGGLGSSTLRLGALTGETIAAGGERRVEGLELFTTADFTPGDFEVRIVADPQDLVTEASEINNEAVSDAVAVLNQNLAVTEVAAAPSGTLLPGGALDRTLTVANAGNAASEATVVRLLLRDVDGGAEIVLEDLALPSLAAGASQDFDGVSALPPTLPPATYRLVAIVDPENATADPAGPEDEGVSAATVQVVPDAPNLVVANFESFDATISRSDPEAVVAFSFDVTNEGGGAAPAGRAVVELTPEGGGAPTLIREIDVPALAPGESFAVDGGAPIPAAHPEGTWRWRVTVDVDDSAAESDETDNVALSTGVLTMTDGDPDVSISAVTIDTADPVAGGPLDISWSLDNLGTAFLEAGEVSVRLADLAASETLELGRVAFDPLPARGGGNSRAESFRATLPRDLQGGEYIVSVVADPDGLLDETNESNNIGVQAGVLQIAALPDGAVSDLALRTAQPTQGELIEFDWTLANASTSPLGLTPFIVELIPQGASSGEEIQRRDAGALDPAQSILIEEQLTLAADTAPGDYVLRVTFDPDDEVDEGDETDNVVELALTVAASNRFSSSRDVVNLDGPGQARAGAGDDVVRGGSWNDDILGEGGDDRLFGRGGRDKLKGGPGDDDLFGGAGNDRAWGGGGDDFLDLGGGRDRGWGGSGADQIEGGGGDDFLRGGGGPDEIFGGRGRDRIFGDKGDDRLEGGGGRDVFVIRRGDGEDEIADFRGPDRVDLRAFGFSGFAEVADRLSRDGRHTELDLPGRGDLTFLRTRPGELDADDFIL